MNVTVCDRCGKRIGGYGAIKIEARKRNHLVMMTIETELCAECYWDFKDWMKSKEDNHG